MLMSTNNISHSMGLVLRSHRDSCPYWEDNPPVRVMDAAKRVPYCSACWQENNQAPAVLKKIQRLQPSKQGAEALAWGMSHWAQVRAEYQAVTIAWAKFFSGLSALGTGIAMWKGSGLGIYGPGWDAIGLGLMGWLTCMAFGTYFVSVGAGPAAWQGLQEKYSALKEFDSLWEFKKCMEFIYPLDVQSVVDTLQWVKENNEDEGELWRTQAQLRRALGYWPRSLNDIRVWRENGQLRRPSTTWIPDLPEMKRGSTQAHIKLITEMQEAALAHIDNIHQSRLPSHWILDVIRSGNQPAPGAGWVKNKY